MAYLALMERRPLLRAARSDKPDYHMLYMVMLSMIVVWLRNNCRYKVHTRIGRGCSLFGYGAQNVQGVRWKKPTPHYWDMVMASPETSLEKKSLSARRGLSLRKSLP